MRRKIETLALDYADAAELPPPTNVLEWLEAAEIRIGGNGGGSGLSEFRSRADRLIIDIEMDAARIGGLFSFTRAILGELARAGVRTAIITRNCEEAVRLVFPDIETYCGVLLARGHVPRVKPDPDHLLRALALVGTPPEFALMVGDHPIDIRTGKSAGAMTAGVFSGNASREDLVASGATYTAADCLELMVLLRAEGLL